jgi:hypothetical protein
MEVQRGLEVWLYSFFNLGARWEVGAQPHALAVLAPGVTLCLLFGRLGGPQGRSGRMRKISPPLGFDPRTVQPVPTVLSRQSLYKAVKLNVI